MNPRTRISGFQKVIRLPAALTLAAGLALPVLTSLPASAQKTAADEKAIRELVLKTIRENPEVIMEALRSLEAKAEAAKSSAAKEALKTMASDIFRHKDDPVEGNPKGDITLVEFFDYNCGFCKRAHPVTLKLLKDDGNIRYVRKEFPILGPGSLLAARAALASRELGKYKEFSNALMESKGTLNSERIFSIAKAAGLDEDKLKAKIESGAEAANSIIRRNYKLAEALDINGTPAFIVGDQVIRGAAGYDAIKAAIDETRKAKK